MFGGAQVAQYNPETRVISLGTEPRKDGSALAYWLFFVVTFNEI